MDWFARGYYDALTGEFQRPAHYGDREEYVKGWEAGNMDYWQYVNQP